MGDGAKIAKTSAEVAEAERARELVSQRIASGHSKQRLSIKHGQGVQRCTGCGKLGHHLVRHLVERRGAKDLFPC